MRRTKRSCSFAASENYVVLTRDLDFSTILAISQARKPSVIQFRSADHRPETFRDMLIRTLLFAAPELERGVLITLGPKRLRMHLLPIGSAL